MPSGWFSHPPGTPVASAHTEKSAKLSAPNANAGSLICISYSSSPPVAGLTSPQDEERKQLVPGAVLINPTVCLLSVMLPTIHILSILLCGYLIHLQPHHKYHTSPVSSSLQSDGSSSLMSFLLLWSVSDERDITYNTLDFYTRLKCDRLLPRCSWWSIYI